MTGGPPKCEHGGRRNGGALRACAAGVGEFPVLVECLCAQNGFVHTSLSLAEDDGGRGGRRETKR